MRKTRIKNCMKCGKQYVWESGGIIITTKDLRDFGLCENCRIKMKMNSLIGSGGIEHPEPHKSNLF